MKILLINGAPSAGKDTIAKALVQHFDDVIFERFSLPNKLSFAAITNTPYNKFLELEYYEEHKDEVIPWLGVSYRQYQIDYAEKFMKPMYGNNIFAKLFLQRTEHYNKNDFIVVPDCGFQVEVDELEEAYPKDEVILLRLHRPDYPFFDSRNYVNTTKFKSFDFDNDGDTNALIEKGFLLFKHFFYDEMSSYESKYKEVA